MGDDPGMDLGAIDAAWSADVGDHAVKSAAGEEREGRGARLDADHLVATALEGGTNKVHDRRLILDHENRRRG
jgi:hypothetical protein